VVVLVGMRDLGATLCVFCIDVVVQHAGIGPMSVKCMMFSFLGEDINTSLNLM
jgi:hypothetical protein